MAIILAPLNKPFFFGVLFFLRRDWSKCSTVLLFHHVAHPFVMSTRAASIRKSRATEGPKPSNRAQPANRRGRARKTADKDEEDTIVGSKAAPAAPAAPPRLVWDAKRTDRLVQWLEDNVEDRQRLFSDSAQDAKEQGRRSRTAKTSKTSFHLKMAEYIFSVDEDERIRDYVKLHGAKRYIKVVENHISK